MSLPPVPAPPAAEPSKDPADWQVAVFNPVPCMLWSAGNRVAHRIALEHFGYHYVWCTPTFEAQAVGRYGLGASQPASSDPATIVRRLRDASRPGASDSHDRDIEEHRKTLEGVANRLYDLKKISEATMREVAAFVAKTHATDWMPLVYAIPYAAIAGRVKVVPPELRAGTTIEYIIPDLAAGECDVIELP